MRVKEQASDLPDDGGCHWEAGIQPPHRLVGRWDASRSRLATEARSRAQDGWQRRVVVGRVAGLDVHLEGERLKSRLPHVDPMPAGRQIQMLEVAVEVVDD